MGTDLPPVALTLKQVVAAEAAWIGTRRNRKPGETGRPSALTGLALSGGGIRSATFCLGVLQAFHARGFLQAFDYLSTVSGGGFIGGWWMAWLKRRQSGGAFPEPATTTGLGTPALERGAGPGHGRPRGDAQCPIQHLRLFSSYLTPRRGLLSGDTWRACTVVLRNLVLTWAVLVPLLFAIVLIGQLYFVALDPYWLPEFPGPEDWDRRFYLILVPIGALAGWLVVLTTAWLFFRTGVRLVGYVSEAVAIGAAAYVARVAFMQPGDQAVAGLHESTGQLRVLGEWFVTAPFGMAVLAWVAGAVALVVYAARGWDRRTPEGGSNDDTVWNQMTRVQTTLLVTLCAVLFVLLVGAYSHTLPDIIRTLVPDSLLAEYVAASGGWLTVASAIVGALFTAWQTMPRRADESPRVAEPGRIAALVLLITPVLVLVAGGLTLAWAGHELIGFLRDRVETGSLRVLLWGTLLAFVLAGLCALAESDGQEGAEKRDAVWIAWGARWLWACAAAGFLGLRFNWPAYVWQNGVVVASFVLLLVASAVLAAHRGRTQKRFGAAANTRPYWILGLAFVLLSLLLATRIPSAEKLLTLRVSIAFIYTMVGGAFLAVGWFTDPNRISLHGFYKSRLTRAFLGASNRGRQAGRTDVAEAVAGDDVRLSTVIDAVSGGAPYLLINATLNLVGGRDLAAQQRQSDRFLLSAGYCGSSGTCYRSTGAEGYMRGTLTLGTAMAISGAAVSPAMGTTSPPAALAAVMALMNLRLGYWIPTPDKPLWRSTGASLWPWHVFREFLSQTTSLSAYCYLTDGGHFDNTGVYSLVERCCRNIVLVDCGADPGRAFDDLANVLRRCRVDFGTQVAIDLDSMRKERGSDFSRCVAVGDIKYAHSHLEALGIEREAGTGTLVVIKPTRIRHTEMDVKHYAMEHEDFPQQSTADQWFDEAQFESYRKLGASIADVMLDQADRQVSAFASAATRTPQQVDEIFEALTHSVGSQRAAVRRARRGGPA